MFYRVEKEECTKGIKPRYNIGQIINNTEIEKIKNDFNKNRYTYYEDIKTLLLEYYNLGIFNNKEFVYSITLSKTKR